MKNGKLNFLISHEKVLNFTKVWPFFADVTAKYQKCKTSKEKVVENQEMVM